MENELTLNYSGEQLNQAIENFLSIRNNSLIKIGINMSSSPYTVIPYEDGATYELIKNEIEADKNIRILAKINIGQSNAFIFGYLETYKPFLNLVEFGVIVDTQLSSVGEQVHHFTITFSNDGTSIKVKQMSGETGSGGSGGTGGTGGIGSGGTV